MMQKKLAAGLAVLLAAGMALSSCGESGAAGNDSVSDAAGNEAAALTEAKTTPYGRYPETITYTLAKMTGVNNSNLPEGETYEDNAYTRLIREIINVQNEDVYENYGDTYNVGISTMIATGNIADIMVVDQKTMNAMQKNDQLADLTEVYANCASDRIKDIYASYGEEILQGCTFDGKLMAFPETNISDGPNLLWVRKDWMEKLGLSVPETIDDVKHIALTFAEENPANQEMGNIGLAVSTTLYGGTGISSEYGMNLIFASFGAYPGRWLTDAEGMPVYGSVQPNVKDALGMLAGCGNSDSGSSNAASGNDSKSTSEAGSTSASASNAAEEEEITTTLTVWSPSEDQASDSGEWLQTMCNQFAEEHPSWHITFDYGVCAESDAKDTVTQDVEGAADVYMFANDNLTSLIAANGISKLGGQTVEEVKENNSQAIVDSVSVDGDIYGVPFTTNTWFMYYDKSAFTEDEVKNLDTMIAKDKISFPITNSWYIASFYVANGCTLFGEDGTDEAAGVDFEGDKAKAVTDYLVDLVNNPNFVSDADGSGLSGLRDGSVKAMFSGSWDASAVKEALGDNYGVVQLPTITINGEEKQMKSFSGSKAIGVNPNCEYPQVAVALARYLGSADAQKAHYEMRNVVPCNEELLSQITDDALVTAQNDTFNNTSIIQPFVKNMSNYWTPAENFGKSLVNGEVTHDNAAEMTEKLNTSMNTSAVE